jgi:hypothetical protein
VPGNNANAGTSASAPKQNLAGMNPSALPAGTRLLFARGGAWDSFTVSGLRNLNATPTNPLVFDAYTPSSGATALPWLRTSSGNAFAFGVYQDTVQDGGYIIRNLKLDGMGTGTWGLFLSREVRAVTVENVELTGWEIAVHSVSDGALGIADFTLRNSSIHHNRVMGMLGSANNLLITGNTFTANNHITGSNFNHAIYLGSSSRVSTNVRVTNNTFTDNSVVNGTCTGGTFTVHGQFDGMVVEGNTMSVPAATGFCWGISITPAYASAESFRNVVVRANTISRMGLAIGAGSSPGILVEDNVVRGSLSNGVAIPAIAPDAGDLTDGSPTIRNNTFCGVSSTPVLLMGAATVGATQTNNVVASLAACPR